MLRRVLTIFGSIIERYRSFRERLSLYFEVTKVSEIARRYFVTNSLDGALTMLGVSIGAFIGGHLDPHIVLTSGLSGAVAIGLSGISGAFLTEFAERRRELKEIEKVMAKSMEGTVIEKSLYFAVLFSAIVGALAPILSAIVVLIPYIFAVFDLISANTAFLASIGVSLVFIWLLGYFLGKISEEKPIVYGVVMLLVGLLTAFITYKLSGFLA